MNHFNLRFAVLAVVIVLAILYVSKYYIADELIFANYQVEALETDLQASLEQLDVERARTTNAEREADVVGRANALLRASEHQRQDEIARLRADLVFYQRLGGATGSQGALAVHHMELRITRAPRVYLLVFTLTQNLRWASGIAGQIQLGLDGIQGEVARHLDSKILLAESADPLIFQFKYFQQFERLITLPEGFAPNRLTIRLISGGPGAAVEQSMQWQNLFDQTVTDAALKNPADD